MRVLNMIGAPRVKTSFSDLRILPRITLVSPYGKDEMLWDLLNLFTRVQNADIGVLLSYLSVCTIIHLHSYFFMCVRSINSGIIAVGGTMMSYAVP